MFRRIEDMEGGEGDPRDFDEWAPGAKKLAKNVLIPLIIFIGVVLLIAAVGAALTSGA